MSEALPPPQPQQDADIATMAADLAKRRRRLQLLNLAILLLPLAAGAIFLAFGRNDREWVRDEVGVSVTETVSSSVAETVEKAVPPAVAAVVEETVPPAVKASVEEAVLPTVRATVAEAVAPAVQQALTEAPMTRRIEALVAESSVSPEDLGRVQGDLDALKGRIATQEETLERHTRQIEGLGRLRGISAADLIRRVKEAEARLAAIPPGLDERLPNLPRPMREGLRNVGQVREDLQELRELLERANEE
jgi:hypothetical protein